MDDNEIIELYRERKEEAIKEPAFMYSNMRTIACQWKNLSNPPLPESAAILLQRNSRKKVAADNILKD